MEHATSPTGQAVDTEDHALPPPLQKLSTILDESPETLAVGDSELHAVALAAAKHIFDLSVQSEEKSRPHIGSLITSISPAEAPQTRSKLKADQNKPKADAEKNLFDFTPLKSLFVDGMDEEQIWAQLDLRTKTVCKMLDFVLEGEVGEEQDNDEEDDEESEEDPEEALRKALEGNKDIDMDEFMAKYGLSEDDLEDSEESQEEVEMGIDEDVSESEEGEEEEEGFSPLRDPEEEGHNPKSILRKRDPKPSLKKKRKGGHPELDDGFFDLAEFNAETERAESKSSTRGRLSGKEDSDSDDMDIDLFASVDHDENFDEEDLQNGEGELYYKDFFEPPSRFEPSSQKPKGNGKGQVHFHDQVRVKKIKATGKNRSLHDDDDEEEEDDDDELDEDADMPDFQFGDRDTGGSDDEMEWDESDREEDDDDDEGEDSDSSESQVDNETIARMKNDLFAEDEEVPDDLTTYERRMAALREQISELESENVAPKEWVLMGEAGSRQRPQNSLLEEDLEFDRVMKAVPVTTEEAVKSLEETIKARILEGRFDDVIRIRPLEDKPFLPSRLLELKDTKSTQSLAQIYENDYVASQTGGEAVDDRDGKLKKEHEEIDLMWEKICSKLDALCNAHFVPKQAKATISTVTNAATASLESALPTSKSTSTMLAPEEIFATSPSSLRARSELTPAEKRAQRSRDRKAKKRQRESLEKSVDKLAKSRGIGGVKKQKQAALESVVKHGKGVTVIGKKGITSSKDKRKK
uniref:U3 small nucleolar ribonucleoprotein protein MPP10 n=1 Tax=Psilocybe cubensis TaxID=181762 RepID=A0A8H7Y8E6_PSICU